MSDLRVRYEHLAALGLCVRGAKRIAHLHGIDRRKFLDIRENGIPISELEHIDDMLVQKLIQTVKDQSNV